MKYLSGYPDAIVQQAKSLLDDNRVGEILLKKYPSAHPYRTDKALFSYCQKIKNDYLRQSPPLVKVIYDDKLKIVQHALGVHASISRVQGGKLKNKKEIRIASLFKTTPEPFLRMIVAHELAHIREMEHNKAFYKLCVHIEPDYHQLEFDTRLYLLHLDRYGPLFDLN
jgi:hypothetical protein